MGRQEHGRAARQATLSEGAVFTTVAETCGLHIAAYHAETAKRAISSMNLVPSAERDLSVLTFAWARMSYSVSMP